jgi:hypothetical protein
MSLCLGHFQPIIGPDPLRDKILNGIELHQTGSAAHGKVEQVVRALLETSNAMELDLIVDT